MNSKKSTNGTVGLIAMILLFFVMPIALTLGAGKLIEYLNIGEVLFYASLFIFLVIPTGYVLFYLFSLIFASEKSAGVPRWVRIVVLIILLLSFSFFGWLVNQIKYL